MKTRIFFLSLLLGSFSSFSSENIQKKYSFFKDSITSSTKDDINI